jgi:hypothetical protein
MPSIAKQKEAIWACLNDEQTTPEQDWRNYQEVQVHISVAEFALKVEGERPVRRMSPRWFKTWRKHLADFREIEAIYLDGYTEQTQEQGL